MYIFPVFINIFMLASFWNFIGEDSVMYYLSQNAEENALKLIEKVYHKSENKIEILK